MSEVSFLKRRPQVSVTPAPLSLWVWGYDTAGRHIEGQFVTRIFFREFLDLPDTIGQDSGKIISPFSAIPEVVMIRPHSTYLAVEWQAGDRLKTESVLGKIIEMTVTVLGNRFGWQERPAIVWLNGQQDLEALRAHEKIPGEDPYYTKHYRWRIGLG